MKFYLNELYSLLHKSAISKRDNTNSMEAIVVLDSVQETLVNLCNKEFEDELMIIISLRKFYTKVGLMQGIKIFVNKCKKIPEADFAFQIQNDVEDEIIEMLKTEGLKSDVTKYVDETEIVVTFKPQ